MIAFWLVSGYVHGQATPISTHGNLSTRGVFIVDEHDQPVQLVGMSLFWSQWMGKYYNSETVAWLKEDWHCTVVRAAMGIESGGYLANRDREKEKVFTVVDAAIREGIYVIVDWHDHHAESHEKEAVEFFSELANKYGQHPNIIYEIYNEPLDVSWSKVIKPYSEKVIAAIRQHDPDNLIACGSRQWSQRVDEAAADPIKGKNIIYTLHYYSSTHRQNLRDIAARAIESGAVLFVTEFGISEATGDGFIDEKEAAKWWTFLDQHKISWCNWSVADKKENSAALMPGTGLAKWKPADLTRSGLIVRREIGNRTK
jgi:endoglucanase